MTIQILTWMQYMYILVVTPFILEPVHINLYMWTFTVILLYYIYMFNLK